MAQQDIRKTMDDRGTLLEQYREDERFRGSTHEGIQGAVSKLTPLFNYLDESGLDLGDVGIAQAEAFQGRLIDTVLPDGRRYKASTIRGYVDAAGRLYAFLLRRDLVGSNPFREMRMIRETKPLPRNLPKERELAGLLEVLMGWKEAGELRKQVSRYKVHLVAELQYATGLRMGEVAALRCDDIDVDKGIVYVRNGKGGIGRVCWLTEYAASVVYRYIHTMRSLVTRSPNPHYRELLFGCSHNALRQLVNTVLNEAAREAGFETFSSHIFRHCLGYHLLRSGCNLRHIQQILGHKALQTTEIYTKVDREDLKTVLDTYHPRRIRKAGQWH